LPLGVARFSNVASYVEDKWCPTELSEKQRDRHGESQKASMRSLVIDSKGSDV
jgi:hypothetical protein